MSTDRSDQTPVAPVACPYDWPHEYIPRSDHLSYRASVLVVGIVLVLGSVAVAAVALVNL